jgi:hypothetical protein
MVMEKVEICLKNEGSSVGKANVILNQAISALLFNSEWAMA